MKLKDFKEFVNSIPSTYDGFDLAFVELPASTEKLAYGVDDTSEVVAEYKEITDLGPAVKQIFIQGK